MNVETHSRINLAALDLIEASSVAFYSRDEGQNNYFTSRAEESLKKIAEALGFELSAKNMEASE